MLTRRKGLKILSTLPLGGLAAAGTLSGISNSERIFMGEYLNASFTGKKAQLFY